MVLEQYAVNDNAHKLNAYIGETVRYKSDLINDVQFVRDHGTLVKELFTIKELQTNYRGETILRGYCLAFHDDFGRPIRPEHVEVISDDILDVKTI